MAEITKERMGEIALAIVKKDYQKNGLPLTPDARRRLGTIASEIGADIEEVEDFIFKLLPELIGTAYGYKRVGITLSDRHADKDGGQ